VTTESILAALIAVGISGLLVVWLALPLVRGDRPAAPPDARLLALLAEREAVLSGIRDLDADRSLGRIGSEEYELRRSALTERGVAILGTLDLLDKAAGVAMGKVAGQIEQDVAALRPATEEASD
jgi:hypothetical protein